MNDTDTAVTDTVQPVTEAPVYIVHVRPDHRSAEARYGTRDLMSLKCAEFSARVLSRKDDRFYAAVVTSTGHYVSVFRDGEQLGDDAALAAVSTPEGPGAMAAMQIPAGLPADDQLLMVATARRAWEQARPGAIAAARAEGMSWEAIGAKLGMSPQGALQVHRRATAGSAAA